METVEFKTKRRKLHSQDAMIACMEMADSNPGALAVIMKLTAIEGDDGLQAISNLDDMNIRGLQLWIAFKDHCKEDVKALVECALYRDPRMVATVNRLSHMEEQAIQGGAAQFHK